MSIKNQRFWTQPFMFDNVEKHRDYFSSLQGRYFKKSHSWSFPISVQPQVESYINKFQNTQNENTQNENTQVKSHQVESHQVESHQDDNTQDDNTQDENNVVESNQIQNTQDVVEVQAKLNVHEHEKQRDDENTEHARGGIHNEKEDEKENGSTSLIQDAPGKMATCSSICMITGVTHENDIVKVPSDVPQLTDINRNTPYVIHTKENIVETDMVHEVHINATDINDVELLPENDFNIPVRDFMKCTKSTQTEELTFKNTQIPPALIELAHQFWNIVPDKFQIEV